MYNKNYSIRLFQGSTHILQLMVSHMDHHGRTGEVSVSLQDKIISFLYRPWVLDTLTRRSVPGTWSTLDTDAMASIMRLGGAVLCQHRLNSSPSLHLMNGMKEHRLSQLSKKLLHHLHILTMNLKALIFILTSPSGGSRSSARNRRENRLML